MSTNNEKKSDNMKHIEDTITAFSVNSEEDKSDRVFDILESIRAAINNQEIFILPVELPVEAVDMIDPEHVKVGDVVSVKEDLRLRILSVHLQDGASALAAFTSQEEVRKGEDVSTITSDIEEFLQYVLMNPNVEGVVINPWGNEFFLPKDFIKIIFEANVPAEQENMICFDTMDITMAETVCIVNTANKSLLGGGGVDGAIHRAAGPKLLEECKTLHGCNTGETKLTKGYNLKADYVIHTVGPIYSGSSKDAELLKNCYWNCLELARENNIHSITFPAISTGVYGYPLRAATEIALKTTSDWLKINPHYGMAIMFACFDDKTKAIYEAVWEENEEKWNQRPMVHENNGVLEEAIQFAMDAHKGSVRKGSGKPFILHPLETLQILSSMDADINLMVAGVLHDTLEDTDTTLLEIYNLFGVDVAALVNGHTEDKRKIWYMRKLTTVKRLPEEDLRLKMLVMADAVANMRTLLTDYKLVGNEIWTHFNAPKEMQAWYYSKINDGLYEMPDYPETADIYWEMTALYKDLFVTYFVDDNRGFLYQISVNNENVILKKGKPQWIPHEGKIPKKARQISRKEAERIEDNWAEPFWDVHMLDYSDAIYELYKSDGRYLFIEIKNEKLIFTGEDYGESCESKNGKQDYEIHYTLDSDSTHRFLVQLRLKDGIRKKLSTILKNEFGTDDGSVRFKDFCDEIGIVPKIISF